MPPSLSFLFFLFFFEFWSLSSVAPSSTSSSLKTSVFASPASMEGKSLAFGPSLHSVLQTQFSQEISSELAKESGSSENSKKLQTLVSYKVK